MTIPVRRLNHAVLYVSDLARSVEFYQRLFGFTLVASEGPMAFLRAKGSANHHDLGLLGLGRSAKRAPQGSTGLYHLAWQLGDIKELAAAREDLRKAGAYTGESETTAPFCTWITDQCYRQMSGRLNRRGTKHNIHLFAFTVSQIMPLLLPLGQAPEVTECFINGS